MKLEYQRLLVKSYSINLILRVKLIHPKLKDSGKIKNLINERELGRNFNWKH
jgi:hypothetical protein